MQPVLDACNPADGRNDVIFSNVTWECDLRLSGFSKEMKMSTLYERLGGNQGIRNIVNDVISAHLANPVIKVRFENIDDIDHAKKMAVEFFCAGSGGPETYTGKNMLAAHKGMNISEQEYIAVMDDIVSALSKNAVDEATKNEVIAILYSLKNDIIRV